MHNFPVYKSNPTCVQLHLHASSSSSQCALLAQYAAIILKINSHYHIRTANRLEPTLRFHFRIWLAARFKAAFFRTFSAAVSDGIENFPIFFFPLGMEKVD
jgi:hypothetical protein